LRAQERLAGYLPKVVVIVGGSVGALPNSVFDAVEQSTVLFSKCCINSGSRDSRNGRGCRDHATIFEGASSNRRTGWNAFGTELSYVVLDGFYLLEDLTSYVFGEFICGYGDWL
jgi:hypothetical protein